ncbi:MAG: hypothetical protein JJT89_00620 [Nitriliruptoraceae bacterium]|nr:hypothetical protein [Nitriliruptoraceae bacterium]
MTGAFRVVDHRAERMAAGVDPGSEPPEVQVVALGSGAGDGDLVAQLRRQHRADPSRRTVVIGRGTVWFDAAFRAGIDAWVDDSADDGTLLAAIVGPAEPVGRSPAGRGPVGRGRAVSR